MKAMNMCGIAGIIDLRDKRDISHHRIESMTTALRHRGPDGGNIFQENGIALGHRRLSIIDLEGGTQPLFSPSGQIVTVFNGMIYNYKSLREELEQQGAVFQTYRSACPWVFSMGRCSYS
jgi:asparagine synthase (glutamine-hydrolysing)